MKKRKIILIFVPVLVVLIVIGVLVGNLFNKDNENNVENSPSTNEMTYSYSRVYLADKDNTLVPLTIKYETFDSVGEELIFLISMLKQDSEVSNDNFNGLLPVRTSVKSLNLNSGILSVDFNKDFASYDAKNELKILESLAWTLCEYKGVNGVSLMIDGKKITKMPVNNTPINSLLTKDIGINNYLLTSSILGCGEKVFSYYEKKIDDKYYYVPVTHYVDNKNDLSIYDLTLNTLFKDPGISSSLDVCRIFDKTELVSNSILENEVLYVSLTEDILYDELTVSLDVYNILKEVTSMFEEVKDVAFLMDLEEVKVNGLNESETEVSKVELNKFYI